MFRAPLKQCYSQTLRAGKQGQRQVQRLQSTSSEKGGSSFGLIATGAVVAGVVGTTIYAKYDANFRKHLEDSIPYSNLALDSVIGPKEKAIVPDIPSTSIKRSTETVIRKKTESESKKETPKQTTVKVPEVEKPILSVPLPLSVPKSSTPPPTAKSTNEVQVKEASNTPPVPLQEPAGLNKDSGMSPRPNLEEKKRLQEVSGEVPNSKDELREQLKLQLSAYNDYLKEQLQLQENELGRIHTVAMEERVLEEKMRYQRELAASIDRLREVERILQVREKLDRQEESSRLLWLLSQRLNNALKSDPGKGLSSEPQLLLKELKVTIEKLTSESEDSVGSLSKIALKSLPKNVLENGVYSEDALIERFRKVDNICQKVSLVDENNSSLTRYLLSYIQYLLVVDRSKIPLSELKDQEIEASSLSTYAILARVRHYLSERNLEMSLRYANQLKGEPRKVASDWIRDVRNHLEVRQISSILQAQSASVTLRTLNKHALE